MVNMKYAFRGGNIFDGATIRENAGSVLVEGGRVTGVGASEVAVGFQEISLNPEMTILPGLIDAFTQLTSPVPGYEWVTESPFRDSARALMSAHLARQMLRTGITSVADFGDEGGASIALREAQELGHVTVPRMVSSGRAIHPGVVNGRGRGFVGVDCVRGAIRRNVKEGADFVGVVEPFMHSFTAEEVMAAADECRLRGKWMVFTSMDPDSVAVAVEAGVDGVVSIAVDGKTLRSMAENDVWWAPMGVGIDPGWVVSGCQETGSIQQRMSRMRIHKMLEEAPVSLQRARTIGVPIIASSGFPNPLIGLNNCVSSPERLVDVVVALSRVGFSAESALATATSSAARAMDDKELGRISKGMKADLTVVGGNPGVDLAALRDVHMVMLSGEIVFQRPIR